MSLRLVSLVAVTPSSSGRHPAAQGTEQRMQVWPTPSSADNHARHIRRFTSRHGHPKQESAGCQHLPGLRAAVMTRGLLPGIMIIRVLRPALCHLRKALRLACPAGQEARDPPCTRLPGTVRLTCWNPYWYGCSGPRVFLP
jgi:hypothetical protein